MPRVTPEVCATTRARASPTAPLSRSTPCDHNHLLPSQRGSQCVCVHPLQCVHMIYTWNNVMAKECEAKISTFMIQLPLSHSSIITLKGQLLAGKYIFCCNSCGALTPGIKLWFTNNFPFTSYTTVTPHSDDFSAYVTSHVQNTTYKIIACILSALPCFRRILCV